MKIYDNGLPAGLGSSGPQKTEGATSATGSASGSRTRGSGGPTDNVSLSNLSSRLSDLSSGLSAARTEQVDKIARLYASGAYRVDAAATSRAIVQDATQPGS